MAGVPQLPFTNTSDRATHGCWPETIAFAWSVLPMGQIPSLLAAILCHGSPSE